MEEEENASAQNPWRQGDDDGDDNDDDECDDDD